MDKSSLRVLYKQKRNDLTDEAIASLDLALLAQLKSWDWSAYNYVHCFLSIEKFKEFNTKAFISWIWKVYPNLKIVVSKSDFATQEMEHFIYDQETHLEVNSWGIPEPVNGLKINPNEIDAVITPLLVTDIHGNRIGYGKGFYDRFFTLCREDLVKIGLSYFEPVTAIDDVSAWDIPIDVLLTPHQIYTF